jgi:hypothetical protein
MMLGSSVMNRLWCLTFRVAKSTASKLSRHNPQGELEGSRLT